MKKFDFSLENVLNLKEKLEDNEKMHLALLENQKNVLVDEYNAIDHRYVELINDMKSESSQGINSEKYSEYTYYIREIDKQKTEKLNEIQAVELKIDKQREVLKQIRIDKKSLEKLKENQKKIYNTTQNKSSEIMIEDFIAGRRM